ncbi:MAG: EAL domain-containing protein [Bacillota bacterium]|nr:EAL domain-containing protein [Bacillota bacterium]
MNKIYINKKLIILIIVVLLLGVFLISLNENSILKSFKLNNEEIKLIKQYKNKSITIKVSPSFIWTEESFKQLEEEILKDLDLNVTFKLALNDEISDSVLFSLPTGIYQSPDKIKLINAYGYLNTDYSRHNAKDHLYNDFNTLINAYKNNEIDALLLPYQGDYIYKHDLKLVELSMNNMQQIYFTSNELKINTVLEKMFDYYLKNGVIDKLINKANILNINNNNYLTQKNSNFLKTKKNIKVGIVNYPAISYIKNKNIYGLVTAYMNNFVDSLDLEVSYIIGENNKLNEMLKKNELDLLFSTNRGDYGVQIFQEPLVITSTHDPNIYFSIEELSNESFICFDKFNSIVPELNSTDFSSLIDNIKTDGDKYFIMPKSMYELLIEKVDIPEMYLNFISKEKVKYYFSGEEDIIDLLANYDLLIDNKRLYKLSLLYIPDETNKKTNWIIAIFFSSIIALGIVIIIKTILNVNEKNRLNYLFKHDQLTYLLNSYGLKKIFNTIDKKEGVLMLIDLHRFKLINGIYGSNFDDQILIKLANQFNTIDDKLIVARTSGNQFTFLLNQENYFDYQKKILSVFSEFKLEKQDIEKLSISACYVEYPKFGVDFDILVKYLESAMYYVKSINITNSWIPFDDNIYSSYLEEQEMVIEIQNAILNEDFELYYQPQVDLKTEKTIGAEVLIRWNHEKHGIIYPDNFLYVAEKNNLMRKIDMYMIRKACEQLKVWQDLSYQKMKISVNISTDTFESKDMSLELIDIIKKSKINTSWFALEITEESGFSNLEYAKSVMDEIKSFGIRFALDDFGTGYSSLNYLEKLPFDFLKIDKAFVDNIHTSKKAKTLYYIITDLAKLYNMHIIVEGVEYSEQIDIIKKGSSPIIQGYYYSKPLPLLEFDKRIRS